MDDAALMRGAEAGQDLLDDRERLRKGEPRRPEHPLREGLPEEPLHHEKGRSVLERTKVVDGTHVGMRDRRAGSTLAEEALDVILGALRGHLDRHGPSHGDVLGLVDGALSAHAEHFLDEIPAEDVRADQAASVRRGGNDGGGPARAHGALHGSPA